MNPVKIQVNLTQDSDNENRKVESKQEENGDNDRFRCIKDYFLEPKIGPKDVSKLFQLLFFSSSTFLPLLIHHL